MSPIYKWDYDKFNMIMNNLPEILQISEYHEGILYFIQRSSSEDHFVKDLSQLKSENQLVNMIVHSSDSDLAKKFDISDLDFNGNLNWNKFLTDLRLVAREYNKPQGLILGAVVEIMNELEWQIKLDIRKLLTLFLHTEQELAHLRFALSGTSYSGLETWRENIIEQASGIAVQKSKIA